MEFKFKQFSVFMTNDVFKVGTDASLLGALLTHNSPGRMLEIGTGTGVISLMIAQRYPSAHIDAIDISSKAVDLANSNFKKSPFTNLYSCISDAKSYQGADKYDVIFSNPPYHTEGTLSTNEMKHRSKSQDNLLIDDLVTSVENNLSHDGQFWVIAPPKYISVLSKKLKTINLLPKDVINVKHHETSRVSRQIVSFSNVISSPINEKAFILYKEQRLFSEQAREVLSPYLIVL